MTPINSNRAYLEYKSEAARACRVGLLDACGIPYQLSTSRQQTRDDFDSDVPGQRTGAPTYLISLPAWGHALWDRITIDHRRRGLRGEDALVDRLAQLRQYMAGRQEQHHV